MSSRSSEINSTTQGNLNKRCCLETVNQSVFANQLKLCRHQHNSHIFVWKTFELPSSRSTHDMSKISCYTMLSYILTETQPSSLMICLEWIKSEGSFIFATQSKETICDSKIKDLLKVETNSNLFMYWMRRNSLFGLNWSQRKLFEGEGENHPSCCVSSWLNSSKL